MHDRVRKQIISLGLLMCWFLVAGVSPPAAHALPEPIITEAGVLSYQQDTGTATIFYAYILGPSPEDVTSFTATGPAGVFDLTNQLSISQQKGLTYLYVLNSVADNGSYTFELTDSSGQTASTVKNFTYDDSIVPVDAATMSPSDLSYVGTTTPTLSFSPVSTDDARYKVYVRDYGGNAFWYNSSFTTDTSVTVPEGLLQPQTAYTWFVRVFDPEGENCHQSQSISFYTGTEALPDVSDRFVISIEGNGWGGIWLGVQNTSVAPWDMGETRVTAPDATAYSLESTDYYFCKPAYYSTWSTSPFPVPDGNYTFELQDDDGNLDTGTSSYVRSTLPLIDEESKTPAHNAYIDSDSVTFSWAPLAGDGPYYYRVRIYDYTDTVRWHDTTPSQETSVTIPVSGNLLYGNSYRWQVLVYDAETQPNNVSWSNKGVFTVNEAGVSTAQFIECIYIAYWGRAADPAGLAYWVGLYNAATLDFAGVAENFANSVEATGAYAYFDTVFNHPETPLTDQMREDFVAAIYQNLFDRVPDEAGLAYWVGVLNSGDVTPGQFIVTIINAAYQGRHGASAEDWRNVHAKTQVAQYFTDELDAADIAWAAVVLQQAKSVLAGITRESDIGAAKQMVDAILNAL